MAVYAFQKVTEYLSREFPHIRNIHDGHAVILCLLYYLLFFSTINPRYQDNCMMSAEWCVWYLACRWNRKNGKGRHEASFCTE
jgi:hypothetical protein